jgi:hypothetical protein
MRTALGAHHLLATGQLFLVLGFALNLALGEVTASHIQALNPFVAFVSAWVGFATGMRFEAKILRKFPRSAFLVGLVPALGAASVVGSLGACALLYFHTPPREAYALALVLAAAAASSGPTLVAIIRRRRPGKSSLARPVLRMLEFSAGLSDLVVILLSALSFSFFQASGPLPSGAILALASVSGGSLLGLVLWLFLGGRATEDEKLLLGIGMLTFIAGYSEWLQLSPVVVAFCSATVLVNLPGARSARLTSFVGRVERPAVVILMAAVGVGLRPTVVPLLIPLLLLMTGVRLLSKRWSGNLVLSPSTSAQGLAARPDWADGLTAQGTLGLIMALGCSHIWRDDAARTVLAAIASASIINELAAPFFYLSLLKAITKAGHAALPKWERTP